MADVRTITIPHRGAIAILQCIAGGLMKGEGTLERTKLHEKLLEVVQSEEAKAVDEGVGIDKIKVELPIKDSTLKVWASGAARAIMSGELHDGQVLVLMDATKALKVAKMVRAKVPELKEDETPLELDDDPEFSLDG